MKNVTTQNTIDYTKAPRAFRRQIAKHYKIKMPPGKQDIIKKDATRIQ
jgi:hypothetical protein